MKDRGAWKMKFLLLKQGLATTYKIEQNMDVTKIDIT